MYRTRVNAMTSLCCCRLLTATVLLFLLTASSDAKKKKKEKNKVELRCLDESAFQHETDMLFAVNRRILNDVNNNICNDHTLYAISATGNEFIRHVRFSV